MGDAASVVVIGAGVYGLYVADRLAVRGFRVTVCERGPEPMARASYANQARVHNGCHYPRSLLTAVRSRENAPRFRGEFGPAVVDSMTSVYAVARRGSKVTAEQFAGCLRRVGAALKPAPPAIARRFDPAYIEAAFVTDEAVFDAVRLRDLLVARAERSGVAIRLNTPVVRVGRTPGGTLLADTPTGPIPAAHIFCCTYAAMNGPGAASGLPVVPLKHELTELALVEPPGDWAGLAVTVMDGPFFSLMPFPARGLSTLSHVRYTPHGCWYDRPDAAWRSPDEVLAAADRRTAFPYMVRDAARFIPELAGCRYRDSLWEVKTLLPRSETDDSRPILFRPDHGLPGYHLVLGGKVDNVYDAWDVIEKRLVEGRPA
jgi:glycine/D-amino acid oxidase-like deaminating enzyme